MTGPLSKRQQARNEKVLQDLVQSVPGNNLCADCGARNPAWASWSLGIFLCMRCATIHRKLGTHVSKVKSLSMDSWSNEQVENMKKVGNVSSNKTYNPQNKRPPVPIDADEADTAMERFIRAKYMNNPLASTRRHNTGSTESDETPPPLPPKTFSRFGSSLRSASSIFPLGAKAKRERDAARNTPPASPRDHSSHRNKPSQVFGVSVGHEQQQPGDDHERKLSQLRDMGFADDHRNAMVLKGVNGNLEKAIEALVRLGEGDGRTVSSLASPRESSLGATRSTAPAKSSSMGTIGPTGSSTNPFDMLDMPPPPAQPQSSQSTGTLQNKNPYLSSNPFGMPAQQTSVALDQAFQTMSLAPSQPLFPHHTGGVPQQQPMYQQTMAPQIPPTPQGYGSAMYNSNQTTTPLPVQQTGYNPFFANQQPQQQSLAVNTATLPGGYANNPFTRSPTRIQSPPLTQIPEQVQQNFYSPAPQPAAPQAEWYAQSQSYQQPQQQSYQQQPQQQPQQQSYQQPQSEWYAQTQQQTYQQPQPLQQQNTNNPFATPVQYPQPAGHPRPDKASIMALYNYPQPAPQGQQQQHQAEQQQQQQQHQQQQQAQAPPPQAPSAFDQMFGQTYTPQPQPQQQQAHVASPAPAPAVLAPASNNNPFMSSPSGASGAGKAGKSRDSMMAFGMEWSNGRHSPDAFASLSARHG
ncbi:ArfGap-domain-containing protein [Coniochaeta ligniaria NRRL 30616]|uniref:ArfGap-domain-containing protein n=1 Tax=Coniochaeta ligniaria NRRL 30616 TaxID=1408157 RepID=A0A1J7JH31_9PEZI|nr:ArfGap-domain-containing protein [Coniochaeta ligniaria NRRL 30616]